MSAVESECWSVHLFGSHRTVRKERDHGPEYSHAIVNRGNKESTCDPPQVQYVENGRLDSAGYVVLRVCQ